MSFLKKRFVEEKETDFDENLLVLLDTIKRK